MLMASRSLGGLPAAATRRNLVMSKTGSCSYAAAAAAPASRRATSLKLIEARTGADVVRTFSSTPASRSMMDSLRNTYTNVKDRGLRALGRETSDDKKMKELFAEMQPLEAKSLQRLYRKRWGAPKKVVDPTTGKVTERILEHKNSTAAFRISHKKLQLLADQIGGGKPVDYSILQMRFSPKRAAKRVMSTLALARDHAIAKGLDPSKLVVSEAWVGKGKTHKRVEIKGRGRTGVQTRFEARLSVVLREGKSAEARLADKMAKEKRIVQSIGTGGVVRINRPIINTHQRPGWQW